MSQQNKVLICGTFELFNDCGVDSTRKMLVLDWNS
jgi:hypothetical protein